MPARPKATRPKLSLRLAVFIALLIVPATLAQTVIYVDADAGGGNNGASWADAYTDLQPALAASVAGNQIWVAAGTYRPAGPGGLRTASFNLRNGVAMYGGFASGETSLDKRDFAANPTILSGDLNGDDGTDFANNIENSYHVVKANFLVRTGVIDGFVITAGNADGSSHDHDWGAGINSQGSPAIRNCTFIGNSASYAGGGLVSLSSSEPTSPAARVTNCAFRGNVAGYGGGLAVISGDAFLMSACLLTENRAVNEGGGMYLQYADLRVTNCTFVGNSSDDSGGAVSILSGAPVFNNCVLNGNEATLYGGAMYSIGDTTITNCSYVSNWALYGSAIWATGIPHSVATNCIFADNQPNSAVGLYYSCIPQWAGNGGVGLVTSPPRFVNQEGPDGLAGTLDDDLRLAPDSPCIDAGDNSGVPSDLVDVDSDGDTTEPTPLDRAGKQRFRDEPATVDTGVGTAPIVDMGAYESQWDCNSNGVLDGVDIATGTSPDCSKNGTPDECERDCNLNGAADSCDIMAGTAMDCDTNEVPDECDPGFLDCNSNGVADTCDLEAGASRDCQVNGVPDECDIALGSSLDSDGDGYPDECECVDAAQVQDPEPSEGVAGAPVTVVLSLGGVVQSRPDIAGGSDAALLEDFECGFRPRDESLAEFREAVERGEIPDPASRPLPVPAPVPAGLPPRIGPLGPDDLFLFEDTNHVGWSIDLMADAANQLISTYGDQWDFVAFWLNFAPGSQVGGAFYVPLYNDVEGIGDDIFNLRSNYGIAGNRIQGLVMMYNVANWDHGASDVANRTRLVLAQEFEHRFALFLQQLPNGIFLQGGFPCGRGAHWNWQVDAQGSGMESREWTGIWPATLLDQCVSVYPFLCFNTDTGGVFSIADLYLMGYVSAAEMDTGLSQFRYMNESDCSSDPYFGPVTPLSSIDIVTSNGPRVPNHVNAQHHFKSAWVMIYQPEAPATPAQIDRALAIMTQQQNDWYFGTLGRGTLDNSIIPSNCTTEFDFFLGTENPPATLACDDAPLPICRPETLEAGTTYYWQVVATNPAGTVTGPVWSFTTETRDCNANGIFDPCDLSCGSPGGPCDVAGCGAIQDCNENGVPDDCDTAVFDCNGNGVPDDCDIVYGVGADCTLNGVPDECDLFSGTETDCDENDIPDRCEGGCNDNGFPDICDVAAGTSADCNSNDRPDECDVVQDFSEDCASNGIPDECEPDCNANLLADSCDIAFGPNWDCNADGLPDGCNIAAATSADCNTNAVPDECDSEACFPLWGGFEPAPPFATGSTIHALDYNGDGVAWDNPTFSATIANQGCPASAGKALKIVSQTPPTTDYVTSEILAVPTGPISSLSFDVRSEAQLNPRIDWQLSIRDHTNDESVILIHWASTQSNYAGVTAVNGRGKVLVQIPTGDPAFLNTGYTITANACYNLRIGFNAFTGVVELYINGTLRVTTTRLRAGAHRMTYFHLEQKANGQTTGGVNRLALDNFTYCASGAVSTPGGLSDCNANGVFDECDIAAGTSADCNADARPDSCERREDFNGDGQITIADYAVFAACATAACGEPACDPALYADPCCARPDFASDGDVDLIDFARLQRVLPASLHDFDLDGDVDLADFNPFAGCLAGPGVPVSPECAPADGDADADADLADFASFQHAFTDY